MIQDNTTVKGTICLHVVLLPCAPFLDFTSILLLETAFLQYGISTFYLCKCLSTMEVFDKTKQRQFDVWKLNSNSNGFIVKLHLKVLGGFSWNQFKQFNILVLG